MKLLYDLALLLMRIGMAIASIFNSKAKAFVKGRAVVFDILAASPELNHGKVVWVHCASLGEFEQGRPLMECIKKDYPRCKIVLTFFSPSGYEVRKNYSGVDKVIYLPWDTEANAHRFLDAIDPILAVFVKYEFWYYYFETLSTRNIPVVSISAIFRPDQLFFKPYGRFYRKILTNVSHFFVQNEASLKLLKGIGIYECSVAGDTRFDRVSQIVADAAELPIASQFKGNTQVFVIGSSWPEDFEVLKSFMQSHALKFIIAPHEISESNIRMMEDELKLKTVRYSQANEQNVKDYNVLIIDNIGLLGRLYRYGDYAYVGGAFGKGLHNILEAACYGMPVFFGNKRYQKFQEAVTLIDRGGAFVVNDAADLSAKFKELQVGDNYQRAVDQTKTYVKENLGATDMIMAYCRPLLQ